MDREKTDLKILVSACLAGYRCRYDGKLKGDPRIERLVSSGIAVPVCPEVLGGLPVPRIPSEIQGERVVNAEGKDVTSEYHRGAEESLRICRDNGCVLAVLKAKSPACGCGEVYDGTFSRTLIRGNGILAGMLEKEGVPVYTEQDIETVLKFIE